MRGKTDGRSRLRRLPCVFLRCVHSRTNIKASCGSSGQNTQEAEAEGARRLRGTHFFGQQGDEVSLKLRLDHLHHMLHLCGLTAVNQLIQRQQLFWASPALEDRQRHTHTHIHKHKERENWNYSNDFTLKTGTIKCGCFKVEAWVNGKKKANLVENTRGAMVSVMYRTSQQNVMLF